MDLNTLKRLNDELSAEVNSLRAQLADCGAQNMSYEAALKLALGVIEKMETRRL
tara:strand:- start:95 stop:256 length:162 start_codon:yes stop_codon:yes gene_type:complete